MYFYKKKKKKNWETSDKKNQYENPLFRSVLYNSHTPPVYIPPIHQSLSKPRTINSPLNRNRTRPPLQPFLSPVYITATPQPEFFSMYI